MKKLTAAVIMVSVCCSPRSSARITEDMLVDYNAIFLSRLIDENADYESTIRKCMDGTVMERNVGIRLIDKFGLFLSRMDQKGIDIVRIRFYRHGDLFSLFLS